MDSEEAVLQMNMLGHNFFIYQDAETNETNIVYRRKDGNMVWLKQINKILGGLKKPPFCCDRNGADFRDKKRS